MATEISSKETLKDLELTDVIDLDNEIGRGACIWACERNISTKNIVCC